MKRLHFTAEGQTEEAFVNKVLRNPYDKVNLIEGEFAKDIGDYRFIPYIQLHEYEALLFTDPKILEYEFFDSDDAISRLESVREIDGKGNPELIDNGEETAPSKRIIKEFPEYGNNKAAIGSMMAGLIGIDALKASCSHFKTWVEELENL